MSEPHNQVLDAVLTATELKEQEETDGASKKARGAHVARGSRWRISHSASGRGRVGRVASHSDTRDTEGGPRPDFPQDARFPCEQLPRRHSNNHGNPALDDEPSRSRSPYHPRQNHHRHVDGVNARRSSHSRSPDLSERRHTKRAKVYSNSRHSPESYLQRPQVRRSEKHERHSYLRSPKQYSVHYRNGSPRCDRKIVKRRRSPEYSERRSHVNYEASPEHRSYGPLRHMQHSDSRTPGAGESRRSPFLSRCRSRSRSPDYHRRNSYSNERCRPFDRYSSSHIHRSHPLSMQNSFSRSPGPSESRPRCRSRSRSPDFHDKYLRLRRGSGSFESSQGKDHRLPLHKRHSFSRSTGPSSSSRMTSSSHGGRISCSPDYHVKDPHFDRGPRPVKHCSSKVHIGHSFSRSPGPSDSKRLNFSSHDRQYLRLSNIHMEDSSLSKGRVSRSPSSAVLSPEFRDRSSSQEIRPTSKLQRIAGSPKILVSNRPESSKSDAKPFSPKKNVNASLSTSGLEFDDISDEDSMASSSHITISDISDGEI